jgi:hypothetical protein
LSHEISLATPRTAAGAAVLPALTARPAPLSPGAAATSAGSQSRPVRIPAYRWRMMVALAAVVASGFLLGMLLTALG